MINFSEGKIHLGATTICVGSECTELDSLSERGLIERPGYGGKGTANFHFETVTEGMRFGVSMSLREEKVGSLVLHWLDGPCTGKGWEGVSDELLREEYRLLWKFVQASGAGRPDDKGEGQRTWRIKWGEVMVSCEQRDFVAAIFMTPH